MDQKVEIFSRTLGRHSRRLECKSSSGVKEPGFPSAAEDPEMVD